LLKVPFNTQIETILLRFDPETGLLRFLEAMRFRNPGDREKILWICEALDWTHVDGYMLPAVGKITWFDQGSPWAVFELQEIVYNVDVSRYIEQTGP